MKISQIKRLGLVLLPLVLLVGCGQTDAPVAADNLPWQMDSTPEGYTQVFHVQVGKTTLRDVIEQWHSFPELAIFMGKDKQLGLEAYFGKQRLGLFEAKVVAELSADKQTLEQFANERIDAKPQASGAWRFGVSEANQQRANAFPVRYLIYMPVADYDPDIAVARFGEPAERVSVKTSAAYWFYPQKGLILLMNTDGSDIFYYSSQQDYPALKQRLLTQQTEVEHG